MLDLVQLPLIERALIAGILLAGLLSYLGVLVVIRKMAFFSDGIAHGSLAGVAAGVLLGVNPLVTALIASVLFAVGMFFLERKAHLSSDTVIGLLFTSGMALGVLLMSFKEDYEPELIHFLFGDIMTITRSDLFLIIALTACIGSLLVVYSRHFVLLSLDRELAHVAGTNPDLFQLMMYVILAVSVALGIKLLGVILVSALLIIPVSISKLISRSFKMFVILSICFSEAMVVTGFLVSTLFNLPTGAIIVLVGSAMFFVTMILKRA